MTTERPSIMVDWLSVETPDPVGIPVNSGQVMRISRLGEVEWTTPARLSVEGSYSSNYKLIGYEMENAQSIFSKIRKLFRH
ncbi:hypothetical protein FMM02_00675 [Sphingomonas xanthus]|uniref:Uncharacterized protein n=1 Tax=Sphingomonas xanthus TaxID=2594473 RepID=A0A516IP99_9SPHN|nr:hypothetical protein FMM02_00675 [Sphingomonas xanthus]